jgi:hypothetical protein
VASQVVQAHRDSALTGPVEAHAHARPRKQRLPCLRVCIEGTGDSSKQTRGRARRGACERSRCWEPAATKALEATVKETPAHLGAAAAHP